MVTEAAFEAFAVLALMGVEQAVIVGDMVSDQVVDDARHLVCGGGDRFGSTEAGTLAAEELTEGGGAAVQGLGRPA